MWGYSNDNAINHQRDRAEEISIPVDRGSHLFVPGSRTGFCEPHPLDRTGFRGDPSQREFRNFLHNFLDGSGNPTGYQIPVNPDAPANPELPVVNPELPVVNSELPVVNSELPPGAEPPPSYESIEAESQPPSYEAVTSQYLHHQYETTQV